MRTHSARANVEDRVLCCRSLRWERPGHCSACVEMARIERDELALSHRPKRPAAARKRARHA